MSLLLSILISASPAPVWPKDLTTGWTAVTVKKSAPGKAPRTTRLELGADGVWKVVSPWNGDADVLAIGRLRLALEAPQVMGTAPKPGSIGFEIELRQGKRVRKVTTNVAELNAPIRITVDGKAYGVSPVELSIKLPDPDDFAPSGLWVAAKDDAISIEVKGPATYALTGRGEDWKAVDGRAETHDLDDVVGVIVGRQVIGHPSGTDLAALGLTEPVATAKVCTAKSCRLFKFGSAAGHCYAIGPDADPLELRDTDWKLLVDGPFTAGGTGP